MIAYVRKIRKNQLSGLAVDGSVPTRVRSEPNSYYYCPIWSSNGELIAALSAPKKIPPDGRVVRTVWLLEPRNGRSAIIFQEAADLQLIGWSASGKDLIVAAIRDPRQGPLGEVDLIQVSEPNGTHTIARLKSVYLRNIQLSPDRHRVAFASHQDNIDNIWLIPTPEVNQDKLRQTTIAGLFFQPVLFA